MRRLNDVEFPAPAEMPHAMPAALRLLAIADRTRLSPPAPTKDVGWLWRAYGPSRYYEAVALYFRRLGLGMTQGRLA